MIIMRHLNNYW